MEPRGRTLGGMLEARRISLWRNRYEIVADGQPLATWDGRVWRDGGTFDLAGRRYDVKSNLWGTRFEMTDEAGMIVATPIGSAASGGRWRRATEHTASSEHHGGDPRSYSSPMIGRWVPFDG